MPDFDTFENRLSRLYTWPQQAKTGENQKNYGANAPQLPHITHRMALHLVSADKEREKIKQIRCNYGAFAPYLASTLPRSSFTSTSSPSPSKMERGPGGEAIRGEAIGGKKDTGYLYKGPPQLQQLQQLQQLRQI